MKLGLTEKQYNHLLTLISETELGEQSEPEAGTSRAQAGGKGYPEVGKWESGVTRGPNNQVGVTKWADVVGSKLTRGKANPLKEQNFRTLLPPISPVFSQQMKAKDYEMNKESEKDFLIKHNAIILKTPPGFYRTDNVLLPKSVGKNVTKYSNFNETESELQRMFFKKWFNTEWDVYVPKGRDLSKILPNGTLRSFTVNNRQYITTIERLNDEPSYYYKFNGYVGLVDGLQYNPAVYFNKEDIPYRLQYHEESTWEKYGNDILLASSFVAGFFFPAAWMGPILMTLNLAAVVNSLIQDKEADAIIFLVFAFLPEIKYALGLKEISTAEAKQLALAFEGATTEQMMKDVMNSLPTKLRDKAYQVLKKDPKLVAKEMDKVISKGVSNLTKEQTIELTNKLNQYIKEGSVNPESAKKWLQKLGSGGKKIGKLGVELVAIGSLHSLLQNIEDKIKGKPPEYVKTAEDYLMSAMGKFQEFSDAGISEGFAPISKSIQNMLPKYTKTFGEDDGMLRFVKMTNRVQILYMQNQNQDFNNIINNIYNEDKNEK